MPDADADVEVRRPVERIEHHAVLAALDAAPQERRLLVFLGGDDGDARPVAEAGHQDVVGDDVELLLRLAVHVLAAEVAEHVFDARAAGPCAAMALAASDSADRIQVKSPVDPG